MGSSELSIPKKLPENGDVVKTNQTWTMTNSVEPWDITTTKWYCTRFKEKDTLINSISKSWCRTWETFLPGLQRRMFYHIVPQTAPGRLLLSLAAHRSMDNVCTVILLPVGIVVKSNLAKLDLKIRSLFLALFTPRHINREIMFSSFFYRICFYVHLFYSLFYKAMYVLKFILVCSYCHLL